MPIAIIRDVVHPIDTPPGIDILPGDTLIETGTPPEIEDDTPVEVDTRLETDTPPEAGIHLETGINPTITITQTIDILLETEVDIPLGTEDDTLAEIDTPLGIETGPNHHTIDQATMVPTGIGLTVDKTMATTPDPGVQAETLATTIQEPEIGNLLQHLMVANVLIVVTQVT